MLWRIKIIFLAIILAISTLLGEICILLRMHQIPEWLYKLGIKLWPAKRAELLTRLGFVYERAGKLKNAKECYEEACKLEPKDGSHYWELGFIYEKQNKIELAIENYEKALQLGVDWGKAFRNEIQAKINKLKSARAEESDDIRKGPTSGSDNENVAH